MTKNDCSTCGNNVANSYCTMQKNMSQSKHIQCSGHKTLPKPKKETTKITKRTENTIEIQDTAFQKFLKKGGHWNFNKLDQTKRFNQT